MGQRQLNPAPAPVQDHRDRVISSLEEENRDLKEQLRQAQMEIADVRNESTRGLQELRKILAPLHNALKLVFGELDAIAPDLSPGSPSPTKNSIVWESWKKKLGGKAAEFIDELLVHGEMTGKQLTVATRCGERTLYKTVHKLNSAQLLNKNGNKYSLKEL